jgi:hypothetical protein
MEGGHATLKYASNTSVVMDIVEFKARLGPGTTCHSSRGAVA